MQWVSVEILFKGEAKGLSAYMCVNIQVLPAVSLQTLSINRVYLRKHVSNKILFCKF